MEEFVTYLAALNPLWVYCVAAAIAYMENVFPPLPSDVILLAAGSLAAPELGKVNFILLLVLSTAGSTAGFLTMYKIGDWFGVRILEAGKFKFIPLEKVHQVETWFKAYGYWIVIANRFMAGTRAVVSFFAGMSELSLMRTTILSLLSSLLWNFILLFAGREMGMNWREIVFHLETYGKVVTIILIVVVIIFVSRYYYKNRINSSGNPTSTKPSDK
ncbi:MAG: DedA family protein [Ignavibacteriales bacterium]|nr:DedA family protein [Ignavibacteriales bacterium]